MTAVEIWQLILEHALIFHPFFVIDPVTDSGGNRYNTEIIRDWLKSRRWEEELRRQSLVLRLVCHSWTTFVDRPELKLRFGRMEDVPLGMSVAELIQARRIQVPHHYNNIRRTTHTILERIALAQSILDALEHADTIFKAEIITHVTASTSVLLTRILFLTSNLSTSTSLGIMLCEQDG
jgi:hypothetical protein